jgi:hypothetical protein
MREDHRDVRALAVRVEKLEAQNRRWKLLSMVIALTGISLVVVGAGRSDTADSPVIRAKTVEAQDFVLKDEQGRIRARLSLYSHPSGKEMKVDGKVYQVPSEKVMPGQAALQFFDERGDEVWVEPKVPTVEHLK